MAPARLRQAVRQFGIGIDWNESILDSNPYSPPTVAQRTLSYSSPAVVARHHWWIPGAICLALIFYWVNGVAFLGQWRTDLNDLPNLRQRLYILIPATVVANTGIVIGLLLRMRSVCWAACGFTIVLQLYISTISVSSGMLPASLASIPTVPICIGFTFVIYLSNVFCVRVSVTSGRRANRTGRRAALAIVSLGAAAYGFLALLALSAEGLGFLFRLMIAFNACVFLFWCISLYRTDRYALWFGVATATIQASAAVVMAQYSHVVNVIVTNAAIIAAIFVLTAVCWAYRWERNLSEPERCTRVGGTAGPDPTSNAPTA